MEGYLTIVFFLLAACLLFFIIARLGLSKGSKKRIQLRRAQSNPILEPNANHPWESEAVFNPAAWLDGERVHLLYRALGPDGISRLGYAESRDGIHFARHPVPVYEYQGTVRPHDPFTSPARLRYDTGRWMSGGGWGGSEDPRMVEIEECVYVTCNLFSGWHSMRVGLLSLPSDDFKKGTWNWRFSFLSPPGRHKNWVLFPEKIRGKFALLHNLFHENPNRVRVAYFDEIELPEHLPPFESPNPHHIPTRDIAWHNRTRSAGPPPLKTPFGWLLLYHAMDARDPHQYKIGALLLDLLDPSYVRYRANTPILEPAMWYENDWKPGIVYASGAVIKDGILFVYYGGGDKRINMATAPLWRFLRELTRKEYAVPR